MTRVLKRLTNGKLLRVVGKLSTNLTCCCGPAPPTACGGCPTGTIPALIGLSISGFGGVSPCSALNGNYVCQYDEEFNFCPGAGCCYSYYYPSPLLIPAGGGDFCEVAGWGVCLCQLDVSGPDALRSYLRIGMLIEGGGFWTGSVIDDCDDESGYTAGDFAGLNCGILYCTSTPATITASVIA